MLIDSLKGKPFKQLPAEIQKAIIIAAAEAESPQELAGRLDKIKKDVQRASAGAVLLLAVKL